jgi:hypothetical protein
MDILQVIEYVKNELKLLSLEDKINLFKEVLNYPISNRDGIFYVYDKVYDRVRMNDYIQIQENWISIQNFDKLCLHFQNLNKKDK